jgi:hypothetical protein
VYPRNTEVINEVADLYSFLRSFGTRNIFRIYSGRSHRLLSLR